MNNSSIVLNPAPDSTSHSQNNSFQEHPMADNEYDYNNLYSRRSSALDNSVVENQILQELSPHAHGRDQHQIITSPHNPFPFNSPSPSLQIKEFTFTQDAISDQRNDALIVGDLTLSKDTFPIRVSTEEGLRQTLDLQKNPTFDTTPGRSYRKSGDPGQRVGREVRTNLLRTHYIKPQINIKEISKENNKAAVTSEELKRVNILSSDQIQNDSQDRLQKERAGREITLKKDPHNLQKPSINQALLTKLEQKFRPKAQLMENNDNHSRKDSVGKKLREALLSLNSKHSLPQPSFRKKDLPQALKADSSKSKDNSSISESNRFSKLRGIKTEFTKAKPHSTGSSRQSSAKQIAHRSSIISSITQPMLKLLQPRTTKSSKASSEILPRHQAPSTSSSSRLFHKILRRDPIGESPGDSRSITKVETDFNSHKFKDNPKSSGTPSKIFETQHSSGRAIEQRRLSELDKLFAKMYKATRKQSSTHRLDYSDSNGSNRSQRAEQRTEQRIVQKMSLIKSTLSPDETDSHRASQTASKDFKFKTRELNYGTTNTPIIKDKGGLQTSKTNPEHGVGFITGLPPPLAKTDPLSQPQTHKKADLPRNYSGHSNKPGSQESSNLVVPRRGQNIFTLQECLGNSAINRMSDASMGGVQNLHEEFVQSLMTTHSSNRDQERSSRVAQNEKQRSNSKNKVSSKGKKEQIASSSKQQSSRLQSKVYGGSASSTMLPHPHQNQPASMSQVTLINQFLQNFETRLKASDQI